MTFVRGWEWITGLGSCTSDLGSGIGGGGRIEEAETNAETYLGDWPEKYGTSNMYNAYIGYCRRIGQNHPVRDTVFGKSIAKYLPSMSKRREGGNNRRHVYLLPSLDQARKDFISVTNIPNTEWAIDSEDLLQ